MRKPGELVQLKVRVPEEVRVSLEEASKRRGVSISAEVTDRLKWSLEREELLPEVLALKFERGPAGLIMALADVMEAIGRTGMRGRQLKHQEYPHAPESWIEDNKCREHALIAGMALLAMMRPRYPGLRPDEAVVTIGYVLDVFDQLRTADKWPDKVPKDFLPSVDRKEAKHLYAWRRARLQGIRDLLGPRLAEELYYKPQNITDLTNAFRSIAQLIEDVQHRGRGLFGRE